MGTSALRAAVFLSLTQCTAAQAFLIALPAFPIESSPLRGAGGPGGFAWFWHLGCPADQVGQPLNGVCAIALLCAESLRKNYQLTCGRDASARKPHQAYLDWFR